MKRRWGWVSGQGGHCAQETGHPDDDILDEDDRTLIFRVCLQLNLTCISSSGLKINNVIPSSLPKETCWTVPTSPVALLALYETGLFEPKVESKGTSVKGASESMLGCTFPLRVLGS